MMFTPLIFLLGVSGRISTSTWYEQMSRQELLVGACATTHSDHHYEIDHFDHILVDHQHQFLYCYVPKVACTNWKRVLMVLTGRSNATNLMDIPASVAHANGSLLRLSDLSAANATYCLTHYVSFVMVRHPFERLLSGYRNKLEDNMPSAKYFQARLGRHIIKNYRDHPLPAQMESGVGVSFREFVRYLLQERHTDLNEHWRPLHHLCRPCTVNYTFVGRYETFDEDAATILEMIGAPSGVTVPRTRSGQTAARMRDYFRQLSLDDIERLYRMYERDFHLFGYDLETLLGFDFG